VSSGRLGHAEAEEPLKAWFAEVRPMRSAGPSSRASTKRRRSTRTAWWWRRTRPAIRSDNIRLAAREPQSLVALADTVEARPLNFALAPAGGTPKPFDVPSLRDDVARHMTLSAVIDALVPVLAKAARHVVTVRVRALAKPAFGIARALATKDPEIRDRMKSARTIRGRAAATRTDERARVERQGKREERAARAQARAARAAERAAQAVARAKRASALAAAPAAPREAAIQSARADVTTK
jgi:hypothetical protein